MGISAGVFIAVLDTSVVSLLLPQISLDFHSSVSAVAWVPNAYVLAYALLIVTAGVLGDRVGRKRVWIGGAALFAMGALGDALAPNMGVLILGRVVQGIGAAAFLTVGMAMINVAFSGRRPWAFGMYLLAASIAGAAGPFLGGAILQVAGWRAVFWVLIVVTAGAAALTMRSVSESLGSRRPPDPAGLALISAGMIALNFGLLQGPSWGWTAPATAAALAVAVGGVGGFIAWELRCAHPMVRLRVFQERTFLGYTIAGTAAWFANLATGLYLSVYLQRTLGLAPFAAGAVFLAWGVPAAVSSSLSSRFVRRFGERPIAITSLIVISASFVPWVFAGSAWPAWLAILLLLPWGWFSSWVHTVSMPGAISAFPPAESGVASATFNTVRQVGSSMGIALPGAALAAISGGLLSGPALLAGLRAAFAVRAGVFLAATLVVVALLARAPSQQVDAAPAFN
ncbi:MAG: MFS transporter [Candidatus Dormibacteria bacterium]